MKKAVLHSVRIWLLLAGGIPLVGLVGFFAGYQLRPTGHLAAMVFLALPSIVTVVLSMRTKEWPEESGTLVALLMPLSVVNACMALLGWESITAAVGALVAMGCGLLLTVLHTRPLALKIVLFALTAHVGGALFLGGMLENFGENRVVQSIPSPDGSSWAEVINDDQGALGGNTLVKICGNQVPDIYDGVFFCLQEWDADILYVGKYWEYETIEVVWKNDHCLIINGQEYEVRSS